jgi:ferric-dicitrate binding protein FerR (iron transport regulator)
MENEMLDIIFRVLKGEASPDDKLKLTEWIAQDQANLEIFKQSESVWNVIDIIKTGKEYDSEKAFNRFKEQISFRLRTSRRIGLYKSIDWFLRIAAILVILLGISYFLKFKSAKQSDIKELSLCEVIAPRGSKTEILLPDGTKVWLNSDSKIHYSSGFNKTDREVSLEGEGYFNVAKNPDKPFIVNTSNLKIRALGTIFNVKSYTGDETIETTLIEGNIVVENKTSDKTNRFTTMVPNQKVIFYRDKEIGQEQNQVTGKPKADEDQSAKAPIGQIVLNNIADPSIVSSWKDNIIYFDNEKFQDLAIRLERRFAVNIHFIDNDIEQMRFTGKFKDIIIEQVLAALQYASPFYYSFNDKDIYISGNPIKSIPTHTNQKN